MGKEIFKVTLEGEQDGVSTLESLTSDSGVKYRLKSNSGLRTLELPADTTEKEAREIWLDAEISGVLPPSSIIMSKKNDAAKATDRVQ